MDRGSTTTVTDIVYGFVIVVEEHISIHIIHVYGFVIVVEEHTRWFKYDRD